MERLIVLWNQHDFRWLFLSQAISTTGDRLVTVALALLVTRRTGSTTDLGLVIGAQSAALVVFLLIGGAWADRLPRHRIMVSTDLVRCALHALLAILILANTVKLWQVIAIEVVFGAAEAFFRPAYSGLVPQTVREELIQDANALGALSQRIADFLGPAIATGIVMGVGMGEAFVLDAATFLASALLLALVRPRPRGPVAPREPIARELAAGYREVRSRPWVWVTIVVSSFALLVGTAPYLVLGPAVAARHFDHPAMYGWIAASVGAGAFAGVMIALRWRPRRPLRAAMFAMLPFSALLVVFALGAPLAVVLLLGVVAGTGNALFGVWWETALAHHIPPAALSRVSSYDWMGSYALLPLGVVLVGALAGALSPTGVMAVGGALMALLVIPGLAPRSTRNLARVEGADTEAAIEAIEAAEVAAVAAHDLGEPVTP